MVMNIININNERRYQQCKLVTYIGDVLKNC